MPNAIQFLESMGRSPTPFNRSAQAYAEDVAALDIEDIQKQALLTLDCAALRGLLGGRTKMMMQIWAPAEDEPQHEDDRPLPDDGKEDDHPDDPPDR